MQVQATGEENVLVLGEENEVFLFSKYHVQYMVTQPVTRD